jgi:hypothetical protein
MQIGECSTSVSRRRVQIGSPTSIDFDEISFLFVNYAYDMQRCYAPQRLGKIKRSWSEGLDREKLKIGELGCIVKISCLSSDGIQNASMKI